LTRATVTQPRRCHRPINELRLAFSLQQYVSHAQDRLHQSKGHPLTVILLSCVPISVPHRSVLLCVCFETILEYTIRDLYDFVIVSMTAGRYASSQTSAGQVALGDCSPWAPTDPCVLHPPLPSLLGAITSTSFGFRLS